MRHPPACKHLGQQTACETVCVQLAFIQSCLNIAEQDHRLIKKVMRPTLGFKTVHSAADTLVDIEITT